MSGPAVSVGDVIDLRLSSRCSRSKSTDFRHEFGGSSWTSSTSMSTSSSYPVSVPDMIELRLSYRRLRRSCVHDKNGVHAFGRSLTHSIYMTSVLTSYHNPSHSHESNTTTLQIRQFDIGRQYINPAIRYARYAVFESTSRKTKESVQVNCRSLGTREANKPSLSVEISSLLSLTMMHK